MKLQKVVINGFRSIKESEILLIDKNVTTLIGANDHGKSNLLEAILRLNDGNPMTEDDRNWDLEESKHPRIEWHFIEEDNEINKLFLNNLDISNNEKTNDEISLLHLTDGKPEESHDLSYLPVNQSSAIIYYKEGVGSEIKLLSIPHKLPTILEPNILSIRPKIEDFLRPITLNLKDEVTYAQLISPEFEFMQGLFQLADIWKYKERLFIQNDETSMILSKGSQTITKILNLSWNQGKDLVWKFEHSGTNGDTIKLLIQDPSTKGRYIRPSMRSSGFQTYFLLSMMINARTYEKNDHSYIFLFDEPGIYLHPQAQLDLQRSFERISDKTQIIFSTHSLFLVNKNHPNRNRVIIKTKDGTKIDQKPFQKNWKSVRESLGILFSNNLLITERTILVEGPSDIIYLQSAIRKLKENNEFDIDLNDFCIVDAGSSENFVAMAKVLLEEGRSVYALVDGDQAGKSIKKKLEKSCSQELDKKLLTIHPLPENKSSEDIFTDIKYLRESINYIAHELINNEQRVLKSSINIETEIKKIKSNPNKTLGYSICEETKTWFEGDEAISKLSISLVIEDHEKKDDFVLPQEAKTILNEIRKNLNLRSEKSSNRGVFEEVSENKY